METVLSTQVRKLFTIYTCIFTHRILCIFVCFRSIANHMIPHESSQTALVLFYLPPWVASPCLSYFLIVYSVILFYISLFPLIPAIQHFTILVPVLIQEYVLTRFCARILRWVRTCSTCPSQWDSPQSVWCQTLISKVHHFIFPYKLEFSSTCIHFPWLKWKGKKRQRRCKTVETGFHRSSWIIVLR